MDTLLSHQGSDKKTDDLVIISVQTGLDGYRLRNFYITNAFQGFVWMIFHFSVIYFFTFLLQNIALVGIFLGFANLVAFFLDIPLGIIQRYIPTKRLFVVSALAQLIATGIFFAFIFRIFGLLDSVSNVITPSSIQAAHEWFFGSALNYIGVIIASICYGLAKELNDVATYGYVLSRSNPSEYGTILARNNITFGIGSLAGLLLSGVLLSSSPYFAVIALAIIITLFLGFTLRYFDNNLDSVKLSDIENFRVSMTRWNHENVKEYIVETVKKADISKIIASTKYLMITPKQQEEKTKVPWSEVFRANKKELGTIWSIFSHRPLYISLLWTIILVLIFGFWDTFASSFLLGFLDEVKPGWSYLLLAIIGVPGILLQEQASKLSRQIGVKTVGIIGLTLSAVSLIFMGIVAALGDINPVFVICIALVNSVGYACGMSTGQNQFLDLYNRIYAEHEGLKEINANASSGPMKVIQNFANVLGLTFGGILLGFGFSAFFLLFGLAIAGALIWTIRERGNIHV